jgi:hypothetical protein
MTSASRTPRAVWKVEEAEFFLGYVRGTHRSTGARLDRQQVFLFFLSAFLNAAYSCREVLRLQAIQGKLLSREAFDRWQAAWERSLGEADARIWSLGLGERHREVHQRGAQTIPLSGLAAIKPQQLFRGGIYGSIVTRSEPTGPLLDDETAAALSAVVPLTFATIQHFEDESGRLDVVETCTRYLQLLRNYVLDANQP